MSALRLTKNVTTALSCALALAAGIGFTDYGVAQSPPAGVEVNGTFHQDKKVRSIAERGPVQLGWRTSVLYEEVENRGPEAVTAVYLRYHCKTRPIYGETGNGAVIYDSLSDWRVGAGIAPGASTWLMVRNVPYGYHACSANVDAVLLTKGRGEGSGFDRGKICLRRQGTYEALKRSVPVVEELASGQRTLNETLKKVASNRAKLAVAIHAEDAYTGGGSLGAASGFGSIEPGYGAPLPDPESGWYTEEEVGSMNHFYLQLESALSPLGTPHSRFQQEAYFPWTPPSIQERSIDDLIRQRGVSRDRARAILLSDELQQWQTALAGQLKCRKKE